MVALSGLLTSCSEGSGTVGGGGLPGTNPQTVGTPAAGDTGNGASTAGDAGDCTHVLELSITSPTRLVNTDNYCDYFLRDVIIVRSLLEIEPGTVIRSDRDRFISIEGGELRAIGTAEQRIVFEGISPVQGFWNGIKVRSARNVVMDYVDIKDAGQVCITSRFCAEVGVLVSNTTFSFTNSSVSNSYVNGMTIESDVLVEAFSNNRFFGNSKIGLILGAESVPMLDHASNYYGLERANGNPTVGVIGRQTSGEVFRWKSLDAPYSILVVLDIAGGILQLEPGVEIVFGSEAWMDIEGNGVFQALGTATDPVILRGEQATPGYWGGIDMEGTNFDTSVLQHTILSDAGYDRSSFSDPAALVMDEAIITMRNSTIRDNDNLGIYCTPPNSFTDASVIYDGGGNSFANNSGGPLSRNCSIQ